VTHTVNTSLPNSATRRRPKPTLAPRDLHRPRVVLYKVRPPYPRHSWRRARYVSLAGELGAHDAVCKCSGVATRKYSRGARVTEGQGADEAEAEAFVTALLTASRVLVGVSARSLSDVESTVTVTQFRTLVVLDSHPEINLHRLAERLGVNSSTALRMLDRLLVAGLVTRRDNPDTRREVLLGLSPEGRRVVRRVTRRRRAELARVVDAMPANRRSELLAALRAFAEAAGEPEPSSDEASSMAWHIDARPDSPVRQRRAATAPAGQGPTEPPLRLRDPERL
jgi:DNA-binding MarR family transcriptional regulator